MKGSSARACCLAQAPRSTTLHWQPLLLPAPKPPFEIGSPLHPELLQDPCGKGRCIALVTHLLYQRHVAEHHERRDRPTMIGSKPSALACGIQSGDEGSSLHSSTFLRIRLCPTPCIASVSVQSGTAPTAR
jgi:hypothetical protein